MALHEEILGMMDQLGITYKDASHCLYMASVEWLKANNRSYKGFSALADLCTGSLKRFADDLERLKINVERNEAREEGHSIAVPHTGVSPIAVTDHGNVPAADEWTRGQ